MDQFIVEGGCSLSGSITPAGNKNEALPVLAATLLTEEPVILRNLPDIIDIQNMTNLLCDLGVEVSNLGEHTWKFQAKTLLHTAPSAEYASKIRGSFLLAGPLLGRCRQAKLVAPGGDKIGLRPVNTHLRAFEKLGASVTVDAAQDYDLKAVNLEGAYIHLDEASVMATENVIMAAVLARGTTTIYNAACEPHVQGLCRLLQQMGAHITGIGSNLLHIEGVEKLHGADYTLQADHTEVGSFIGLAAVTRSELRIQNAGNEHLSGICSVFEKLGVYCHHEGQDLYIPKDQPLEVCFEHGQGIPKIDDAPWPGFPADLTSIITVVATQCKGAVLIFEKMFESRLFWIDKLIRMGAQIILCDPHRAVVSGPSQLHGTHLSSPDIRAGMAMLIAALGATGQSTIQNIQQIDRGYDHIDQRLNALGASIQRVST